MAVGDVKWFAQALTDLGNKQMDLSNDVLKLAIVTNAVIPTTTTAAPHFGGVGTTNFSTNQVSTAGTSYTGPITLANKTWVHTASGPRLRADIVDFAQDAAGFTIGAYGIIYDHTDPNKRALGWVELSPGGQASLVAGPIKIDWNAATNDILALAQV